MANVFILGLLIGIAIGLMAAIVISVFTEGK